MRPGLTFRDTVFVCAMGVLIGGVTLFEDSLSAYFRVPAKFLYAGMIIVGIASLFVALKLFPPDPIPQPLVVPVWKRGLLALVLVLAVVYFFMREELAGMVHLRLRALDAIMLMAFAIPVLKLMGDSLPRND